MQSLESQDAGQAEQGQQWSFGFTDTGVAIQPSKSSSISNSVEISKSFSTKLMDQQKQSLLPPNISISPSITKSAPSSPRKPTAGGSSDSPDYMKRLLSPLKVNAKFKELMDMQLSPLATPLSGSSTTDQQRCFICWEISKAPDDMVVPCQCKNVNLKYAHKDCIERWVNESHKTQCNVCMTEYAVHLKAMPYQEIFTRNKTIILSFLAQILLPIILYSLLFYWGVLHRVSGWIILGHLVMLLVLYSTFAVQVFRKLNRYHRKVENFSRQQLHRESPP